MWQKKLKEYWYPPILAYHKVQPTPSSETPVVSPEAFEKQMRILALRWRPVPLSAIVESLETGKPLPQRAVAVTFDDGTEDNFTFAFPILARWKIPAIIFLTAGEIGWTGFLTPPQIKQMAGQGISFGSHSLRHEYLPALDPPQLERALRESKRKVEDLGVPAEFMSFPGGGFSAGVVDAVQKAGYRAGCTTNRGFHRFPPDRWALRRITVHDRAASPAGLWLRCCGYYGINRHLREPA